MFSELDNLARQVINYDIKAGVGGRRSTGSSSGYGKTLKFLISRRRITLAQFARACNMSSQAFNHIVNHSKQENFTERELDLYCSRLGCDRKWLDTLSDKVYKLMGGDK